MLSVSSNKYNPIFTAKNKNNNCDLDYNKNDLNHTTSVCYSDKAITSYGKALVKSKTDEETKNLNKFITKLTQMTTVVGEQKYPHPRFCSCELARFARLYKENPNNIKLINKYINMKTIDSDNIERYRFNGWDIDNLIELRTNKSDAKLVDKYVDMTTLNFRNKEIPRFDADEIRILINLRHKNPDNIKLIDKYIAMKTICFDENKTPRFTVHEIENLIKLHTNKSDAKLVDKYVAMTRFNFSNKEVPRFNADEIKRIINLRHKNPDNTKLIDKYIAMKTIDFNDNETPRFTVQEIENLIKLRTNKSDTKLVDEYIDIKILDDKNNELPRFSADEINKLVNLRHKNPDNIELIDKYLNMKTLDAENYETPRFDANEIEILINLNANKSNAELVDKYLNLKTLDTENNEMPRFGAYDIKKLIELQTNKFNTQLVNKYISMKTTNSDNNEMPRFDADEIEELINIANNNEENSKLINHYLSLTIKGNKTKEQPRLTIIDIEEIIDILPMCSDSLKQKLLEPNNKFLDVINCDNVQIFENQKLVKYFDKNFESEEYITKINNDYDKNEYIIKTRKADFENLYRINIDNQGNITQQNKETQITKTNGNKLSKHEFLDGRKLVEEISYCEFNDENIPTGYKKTMYDSNGVQTFSEVVTQSKENAGDYTMNVYTRGLNQGMQKKQVGTIKIYGSKDQGKKMVRTVESTNGTLTTQTIIKGPKGSSSKYEIKDKNGNILFSNERQFNKIDENHYTSSLNGQKYDMVFDNNKITVSKLNIKNNVTEKINLNNIQLNFKLLDLYKQLPGDFFFKMKEKNLYIKYDYTDSDNAYYLQDSNSILMGKNLKNDTFGFAHEFGHFIDYNIFNNLHEDANLKTIFEKELMAYRNNSSLSENQCIDYFTIFQHPNGDGKALTEVIAETNALLSGFINSYKDVALRGIILQQHFPETIAYIGKNLDKTDIN